MPEKKCWQCGKVLADAERRLYSSWSKHYYCIDVDACKARTARRYRSARSVSTRSRYTASRPSVRSA